MRRLPPVHRVAAPAVMTLLAALLWALAGPPNTAVAQQDDRAPSLEALLAGEGLAGFGALLAEADVLLGAPLTVFAPTDVALAAFAQEAQALGLDLDDPATRNLLVGYHVVQGAALDVGALAAAGDVTTAEGEALAATFGADGTLLVNDGRAGVLASARFDGGVLHTLDYVLLPPVLAAAPPASAVLPTLYEALQAVPGRYDTLQVLVLAAGDPYAALLTDPAAGPVTLVAPTDAAFRADGLTTADAARLPRALAQQLLAAHVLDGARSLAGLVADGTVLMGDGRSVAVAEDADGTVRVNGARARVLLADVPAANGVLHVLDRALDLPPGALTVPLPTLGARVNADPQFTVLAALLATTDAGAQLAQDGAAGSYTLLAPTDAAFAALAAEFGTSDVGALAAALDGETLARVAAYHVLAGSLSADALAALDDVPTLEGARLRISVGDDGVVLFDGGRAGLAVADVPAANGVLHILDAVLLPPGVREQLGTGQP